MQIRGVASMENVEPLVFVERGQLQHVEGLSAASYSLAAHIIERQTSQALARLRKAQHRATIEQAVWETASPGTVVFLRATFAKTVAGCFSLGARAKTAEQVADSAVDEMLAFLDSPGVVDAHASDQLLTLAALSPHESCLVAERISEHLTTNANVIRQLTGRQIDIEPGEKGCGRVTVRAT